MRNMFRKLKSKAGESLIESLCAILIFTMASVVLYSLVTAAADINNKAKIKDEEHQAHMVAVERGDPDAKNGVATVNFSMANGSDVIPIASVNVDIYGGEDDSLYTYFVQTNTED